LEYWITDKMSSSESMPKFKPLSNSNYPEWCGEMKAWLMRNGLWKLVSGRETKPSEEEALAKWEAKAERAAGEIYLMVENDQRVHFRGFEEDPIEMWKKLESANLSKKPGARFNAYDDLFSIHKENNESLIDIGVRIEKAMATIQNLRPSDFTIEKLDEELQCMALIRALPEEYRHLSSSLLLMDKLDKNVILQAFRSEELNRQRQTEMVNRAKAFHGAHGKGQWEHICGICGKKGHWDSRCYHKDKKDKEKDKDKDKSGTEGAKKAVEEKAAAVTEFAGKASAVSENEANSTSPNIHHWNTDTGATSHMTPHRKWIRNYTPYKVPIRLADSRIIYSEGVGTVVFRPIINGQISRDVELSRVLHVPALQNNLLAVLYLTRFKGFTVHISSHSIEFTRNDTTLFTASINSEGIGYLNGSTIDISENVQLASTLPLDLNLWHRRLGHLNYDGIKKMLRHNLVTGLTLDSSAKPDPICEPCLAGKMHANPFPSSDSHAEELLELIHSDLHYIGTSSHSGYNYWITFIDDYSRFKAVVPLKRKSDAFDAFKIFKAFAENQTGRKIKKFRCDKGGEYMSNEFIGFLDSCGILKQYTVRNRPQQNGVAERANRTLAERITAMLDESGLSKRYWGECLAALVHVLNCCPTSIVTDSTPYEIWHNKKPDIGHLRVWGCVAYVHVQKDKRQSLGPHMEKCIFIGYAEGYKGWKFYNPITKKVIISERADFDERYNFGGSPIKPQGIPPVTEPSYKELIPIPQVEDEEPPAVAAIQPDPVVEHPEQPEQLPPEQPPQPEPQNVPEIEVDDRPIAVRRPRRNVQPPGEWWKVREPTPAISDSEEESENDQDNDEDDDEHANAAGELEPSTYAQAIKGPDAMKWNEAMLEEYNAHLANGTWTVVKLPPGQMVVKSKWVYRIKHNADGSIERFKARLVAKGFSQRPGIDYFETFASTMRHSTIRVILALAAVEDLHLRSVDISHAFINSDIDAEVYMAQPLGYVQHGPKYVCKLNKSIYGLKQSSRLWGEKLCAAMLELGFKKAYSDPSLYIFDRDNIRVIVPVFVDDITLASKSTDALDKFVAELATYFKLRDLGPTSLLLGVEITRDRTKRTIHLSQSQYILNKLNEFDMADCKPVGTPMLPGLKLSSDQCPQTAEEKAEMQNIPYINAVGSLLYLALLTRPDIAYAAGVLARFNSNPGMTHWKAVKHLFRYLKGTVDLKLAYGPDPSMDNDRFITFCDADHGGNKDNGKSTSGYMVKLGSGVVCWSSKLQPVVALSTTEAEYVAGVAAGKEICWLQNLLNELGYTASAPSKLYIDNQSALSVAKNPEHHGRMKHLDLSFYWLRDKVQRNAILPIYLQTEEMPADLLTKALPKPQVLKLRGMMGLVNGKSGG
jgi:transposase InsO family protein